MEDEFYMKEALEEAKLALKEGNWPIGCVIVLDGKIISRARGQTHSKKSKLEHAEINALKEVQETLRKNKNRATLYTTYEPCPMCLGAIILNRIKRVVSSGVDIDKSGAMHLKENLPEAFKHERFKIEHTTGVLTKECEEVFMQGRPTKSLIEKGIIKISQKFSSKKTLM